MPNFWLILFTSFVASFMIAYILTSMGVNFIIAVLITIFVNRLIISNLFDKDDNEGR